MVATESVNATIGNTAPKPTPGRGGNMGGGGAGGGGRGVASGTGPVTARRIESLPDPGSVIVILSPEEQKRQQLVAKFHPSLVAVVDRLRTKVAASPEEARFVRDGKAELQVWLTDKTPEALTELKQLGFEVILDPRTSKLVIGRLTIENLQKLAELKLVRYVAPQTTK
jgi:hypothetical protein